MRDHFYSNFLQPLLEDESLQLIQYLQRVGILDGRRYCPACTVEMPMVMYTRNVDKFAYRCMTRNCINHKKYFSLRKNSIFEHFNFSLVDGIKLCWKWMGNSSQKEMRREINVEEKVLIRFFNCLRSCCDKYILHNPVFLGGNSIFIQIDESLFRHKPKNHRGRATSHELWVFGMADTSYSPAKIYLELVEDRTAATLLPIIRRVSRLGSVIISDEWAAYRAIDETLGFDSLCVNHSLHFVDPETGAHTQNIESYWAKVKLRIKVKKGILGEKIESYLNEWMWKDNIFEDNWINFINLVKFYY